MFAFVFCTESYGQILVQTNLSTNNASRYYNDFDLYFDLGFPPIKLGAGFGYLFNNRWEIILRYDKITTGYGSDYNTVNLGMKYFLNGDQTIYTSVEAGILNSNQPTYNSGYINGGNASLDFGYVFYKSGEFYIQSEVRAQLLLQKYDKSKFIPGIDLSFGWYINR